MLMHAIAYGGCTDTVRESALKADSGEENALPHMGLKPASVLRLSFQSDALLTGLPIPFVLLPFLSDALLTGLPVPFVLVPFQSDALLTGLPIPFVLVPFLSDALLTGLVLFIKEKEKRMTQITIGV